MMIREENFIITDVHEVFLLGDLEFFEIQILLLVVPLHFDHGPFGVLGVTSLWYYPYQFAYYLSWFSLPEK